MTNIEVQATRVNRSTETTNGREKYDFAKGNLNTPTPIYVWLALVALAAYLKSVLISSTSAGTPEPESLDEQVQAPNTSVVGIANENENPVLKDFTEEQNNALVDGQSIKLSSSAAAISIDYYKEFSPIRIQYAGLENYEPVKFGQPINFSISTSNDNVTLSATPQIANFKNDRPIKQEDYIDPTTDDSEDDDKMIANRRPVVARPVVLYDQFACATVIFAMSDLLQGATDPDGDRLEIRNVNVSSGEILQAETGLQYTGHETGPVTITFQIFDGQLGVMQTALFNVIDKLPIVGTPGDDNLLGTMCDDRLFGDDGNDQIDGRSGDDKIDAGNGDDHIVAGDGDDIIFGRDGNDIIFGGRGNDTISGGHGDDRVFGGDGDDVIDGNAGDDKLAGDAGNDVILGGIGKDEISDGQGRDSTDGEAGDDTILAAADATGDLFNGGTGIDRIDYSASLTNLVFDLEINQVSGEDTGDDQVANFEVYVGGQADDRFAAVTVENLNTVTEIMHHFAGGAGTDILDYSHADSSIAINVIEAVAVGLAIGIDTFQEIEHFVGTDHNDHFVIAEGSVTLEGRQGDDLFEFITSPASTNGFDASHHIVNFEKGDLLRMSKYDIFEEVLETLEDAFEQAFENKSNNNKDQDFDDLFPIRIRHELSDLIQNTFIEADFDKNSEYEIKIQLNGNHNLMIVCNDTN